MPPTESGARQALALVAISVLLGSAVAFAGVVEIDPARAGSDLGAAVNRAVAEAPGMLIPDATVEVTDGSLIALLSSNAVARAVPKNVTALQPGEYGILVSGVTAGGAEVAVGERLHVTVSVGEVLEIVLPEAVPPITAYSVYVGSPGAETIQTEEAAPGTTLRLIDPTEFFNRRAGEVPYYPHGPGPPAIVRIIVAAYAGDHLVRLGAEQSVHVGPGQSVRVTAPNAPDLVYAIFAATGVDRQRLQLGRVEPGSSRVLRALRRGADESEVVPSRAHRVEIAPGDYEQTSMIVIDRPEVTLSCSTPSTIRVVHGFDQAAVMVNPSILHPVVVEDRTFAGSPLLERSAGRRADARLATAVSDNVGIHRLYDVTIENCTWDMTGQIETATLPVPADFRNYAVMAWATDGLTLRGLRIRNNLRGGVGVLSCSNVRIEGNSVEHTRGRALSNEQGQLLPGRGVGNAINVSRNSPFSDAIGDEHQTRTVITNNIIVGDEHGEMYGIVVAAGGATDNTITGNTISHLRGACIALEGQNTRDSGRTTISGNSCTNTAGIQSDTAGGGDGGTQMRGVTITGNTIISSRAAGIAVSSSSTVVVGNVVDGCHLDSTASGCVMITPPRPALGSEAVAAVRNLLVANNVIVLGPQTRSQPPVGIYVNGPVPITHLLLGHNRIDCERTANSTGVQISGDVTDVMLRGNDVSDCGGDGVVVTDFGMAGVEVPQRLIAVDNVFRNLNLSGRWMDSRHAVGAAFRFEIEGAGNVSAGHRLRGNRLSDADEPPGVRYGVILDVDRPGAITDVRLEDNEWKVRIDELYDAGATNVVVR